MYVGHVCFNDTERGATSSRGWWIACDVHTRILKRVPDLEDRVLEGKVFRSVGDPAARALAAARRVWPEARVVSPGECGYDVYC